MVRPNRRVVLLICTLFLTAWAVRAQKHSSSNEEQSCRRFAQDFYNWYLRVVRHPIPKSQGFGTWLGTSKYKERNPFSPELARALIESDAEAKIDGDPVLDFDPVLNTQDPADHYAVRNVIYKNGHYWAEVYGIWARPVRDQGKEPQVVAELVFQDNRWSIVNFHYPDPDPAHATDLLRILRSQYHSK